MLKNKLKLLLATIMVICMALSPLCFADDEPAESTEDKVLIQENTEAKEENKEAGEKAAENEVKEEEVKIKSSDDYVIGESVKIDYVVDGNLFVIANDVTIDAQVIGNAFVIANKITITEKGYISSSLFALGSDVEVDGVSYDCYISSNNLKIKGYIYRDVYAACENFKIIGSIGRNASVAASKYSFEQIEDEGTEFSYSSAKGRISGDFNYTADSEITIPDGVVEGKTSFNQFVPIKLSRNYVIESISAITFALLLWLLLKWIAPKFLSEVDKPVTSKIFKTLGFGLLSLIVIPIIAVILLILGVTSKAGLSLISVYCILLSLSRTISVLAFNNIIANKFNIEKTSFKAFAVLILTSIVATALTFIPFVGLLVALAFVLIGLGIITRKLFSKKDKEAEE